MRVQTKARCSLELCRHESQLWIPSESGVFTCCLHLHLRRGGFKARHQTLSFVWVKVRRSRSERRVRTDSRPSVVDHLDVRTA